jgi:predicted metallo-beta-lactamase superfamily hydrolase
MVYNSGRKVETMNIRILASESLGVRSMACVVETTGMKILIDPGTALGPKRFRLPPHPVEQETAQKVQKLLYHELADATHIVITHFHGDHHPMVEADISQLSAHKVLPFLKNQEILVKSNRGVSRRQKHRRRLLEQLLGKSLIDADNKQFGELSFSEPVPHGEPGNKAGTVIMAKLTADNTTFVHGSDIQLLNHQSIEIISNWKPDITFIAGPPLYILESQKNTKDLLESINQHLARLTSACGRIILDHHIMRSRNGEAWLDHMSEMYGKEKICCAADFSQLPRNLLEANRKGLFINN